MPRRAVARRQAREVAAARVAKAMRAKAIVGSKSAASHVGVQ